jgi:FkbM family methyltransferase
MTVFLGADFVRKWNYLAGHPAFQNRATITRLMLWTIRSRLGLPAEVSFPSYQVKFHCPPDRRGISRLAYLFGESYDPDARILKELVPPGAVVIDVGAHYGTYSLILSRLVGPAGRVIAIEPSTQAYNVLRHNIGINCIRNVDTIHAAVGAEQADMTLYKHTDPSRTTIVPANARGYTSTETVPVYTLDELLPCESIALMKIDVEGAESLVLSGAYRILSQLRPTLFFEYTPLTERNPATSCADPLHLLRELKYRLYGTSAGRLFEIEEPSTGGVINLIGLPHEAKLD